MTRYLWITYIYLWKTVYGKFQETYIKNIEVTTTTREGLIKLGLQTIHEDTISYIRRGYANDVYDRAVVQLKDAGIHVVTHIIIGLPGEDVQMAVQTTQYAVKAGTDGVKFHLLHVLKGTDLAEDFAMGKFRCLELAEYAKILKACLDVLPPKIVVYRITGDGAKKDLIAPLWSANKKQVLNYLNQHL